MRSTFGIAIQTCFNIKIFPPTGVVRNWNLLLG